MHNPEVQIGNSGRHGTLQNEVSPQLLGASSNSDRRNEVTLCWHRDPMREHSREA